jgi:ribosomal protein S18 acetylase RimI-like enzyme
VQLPTAKGGGDPVVYRPGRAADLDACTSVWKAAIDDYQRRLNQPPLPNDLAHLRNMLSHLITTDPDRFWVAVRGGGPGPNVAGRDADAGTNGRAASNGSSRRSHLVGFAAASVRDGLWFLAMLFVDPASQAEGVGKALMDRAQAARDVDPGGPMVPGPDDPLDSGIHTWGMCTDSVQPISNALYAGRGMVPRIPIWRLSGEVRRWSALAGPPAGVEAVSFETFEATVADGPHRLASQLDDLDRELIGVTHPIDHAHVRREGRSGVLLRERHGRVLGYAYGSSVGRLGPVAAVDPALHPALIGLAIREAQVFGPVAIWVAGTADRAFRAVLAAGLRLDTFPGIICWSRPDHPFARYLPISLAII